jgi:hypothetical protein
MDISYVRFLESVALSLLKEREQHGKTDNDEFEKLDLDRGANDRATFYSPVKVKEHITNTNRKFFGFC